MRDAEDVAREVGRSFGLWLVEQDGLDAAADLIRARDAEVAARTLREAAEVFAKFAKTAPTHRARVGWDSAHGALLGMADEAGERDE